MTRKATKKLPSKHFVKMNFIRWRRERGIKLVATIMPLKKEKRASCLFEGKTYLVTAPTNAEALKKLTDVLIKEAGLDIEPDTNDEKGK